MRQFSRARARWDMVRVASIGLAMAMVGLLAAFAFAATTVQPSIGAVLSALALLAIAGAGFLYAWREPGA